MTHSTEVLRQKGERAVLLLAGLYPDAACSLAYGGDPWKLLVMARLSAQCTDARVNIVCGELFCALPDARSMADAPLETIESYIRPCGLYHTKAKSLKEAAAIVADRYGGSVPGTMEELLALPGVGRKIANLLLGDVYGQGGIVADTHCIRICGRLGFYPEAQKDPLKTERILDALIPREEQSAFCHRLVMFGRDVCMARSPQCAGCPLREICDHAQNG
ncbi:MAG: endonuclease III domain-containing protein [Eubacteriales bacterium]